MRHELFKLILDAEQCLEHVDQDWEKAPTFCCFQLEFRLHLGFTPYHAQREIVERTLDAHVRLLPSSS